MVQTQLKQALLVIDIQNDFTGDRARKPIDRIQADEIIGNINKIIERAHLLDLTVIYIGNEYSFIDPLNIFRNFAAIKGTEGAKLDPNLKIIDRNYFSKQTRNAFSNPALNTFLKQNGIGKLLITGVYAEACILRTIEGGLQNGFQVEIIADCVGTVSIEKRQACLHKYKKMGVKIVETDMLIKR